MCEIDINECDQKPCLNGGRCIDGINNFTCDCSNTGFEGYLCEVDVDECRRDDPCVRGRCSNLPGSFICHCDAPDDCGRRCDRKDPCKQEVDVCHNGASCTAYCDEPLDTLTQATFFKCSCLEGFQGRNCSVTVNVARCLKFKRLGIDHSFFSFARLNVDCRGTRPTEPATGGHHRADRGCLAADRSHRKCSLRDDGAQQAGDARHLQPQSTGNVQPACRNGPSHEATARGAPHLN